MSHPALHLPTWLDPWVLVLPYLCLLFLSLFFLQTLFCSSVKPSLLPCQAHCPCCSFPQLSHGSFLLPRFCSPMSPPWRGLPWPSCLKWNAHPITLSSLPLPHSFPSTNCFLNMDIYFIQHLFLLSECNFYDDRDFLIEWPFLNA